MSTSSGNAETTRRDTRSADLARLRMRLWRLSSLLTCSVLIVALASTWLASAAVAASMNRSLLRNELGQSVTIGDLNWAREHSDKRVNYALDKRYNENANVGSENREPEVTYGTVEDSTMEWGPIPLDSFRVAQLDDGSVAFLDTGEYTMASDEIVELVERAVDERSKGDAKMPEQVVQVERHTWLWTTQIISTTNGMDYEAFREFSSMNEDLSQYANAGMLAARIYCFVDITASVLQLKLLVIVLGIAGIAGCILLVIVCRKIIDCALKPVGEAWDRQREFLIKASHELKTPMASLSSNLDALVVNGDETVASQAQWTDNMREDIDQLADRTCRLLDLVTQPDEVEEGPEEK